MAARLETHRLLVVSEGTSRDAAVLATAATLLRAGSGVVLLRVIAPPAANAEPVGDLIAPVDRAERAALAALRRLACALPGARVTPVVLVGTDRDAEIARWLATNAADAVVIPARERRWFCLLWPGRRAPRLAGSSHTTVLTVYPAPPSKPSRPHAPRAA